MLTKVDFTRRYKAGEFGNAAPTWNTLGEYLASGYQNRALIHIRNRVVGGPTWYNVSGWNVEWAFGKCVEQGAKPDMLYLSAMAPHQYNLIQGEVVQSRRHLELLYTCVPDKPMRESLAIDQRQASGIVASSLLQRFMCSNSWEWLQCLLDRYPLHVIEFSTFSRCWGTIPRFNSVFWEVRRY